VNFSLTIGVLALQGSYSAHLSSLKKLSVNAKLIRQANQLAHIDALIIPGGESTTMLEILVNKGSFWSELQQFALRKPCLGTCAGAILLASSVENPTQDCLGALDITVKRNAYGRQLQSSIHTGRCMPDNCNLEFVFIRAPKIVRVGPGVEVLAEHEGNPVWVRQGQRMATTFHPELTSDLKVYRIWIESIKRDTLDGYRGGVALALSR